MGGLYLDAFQSQRKHSRRRLIPDKGKDRNKSEQTEEELHDGRNLVRLDDLPLEVAADGEHVNTGHDLAALLRAHISGIPLVITFTCSERDFASDTCSRVYGLFHCSSCLTTWKDTGRVRSVCPQNPRYVQGSVVHLSTAEATMLVDILYCSKKHVSQVFEEMFPLLRKAMDSEKRNRVLESMLEAESSFGKPEGEMPRRKIIVFAGGEVGPNGLLYPYGRHNEDGLFNAGGPPVQSYKNVMKFKDEFTDQIDAENDFFEAFGVQSNKSGKKESRQLSKAVEKSRMTFQPYYGDGVSEHRDLTRIYQKFFRRKDVGDNEAFRYAGLEDTTQSASQLETQRQLMNKILMINERCRRHSLMDSKAMECNRIYNTKTGDRSRSPTVAYVKDMSDQSLPLRSPSRAFKAHFPPKQSTISQATTIKLYCPIPTQVMREIRHPIPAPTPTPCRSPDAAKYATLTNPSQRDAVDGPSQAPPTAPVKKKQGPNRSAPAGRPVLNAAVKNRTGRPPTHKRRLLRGMIRNSDSEEEQAKTTDAPFSAGFYYDVFHTKITSELTRDPIVVPTVTRKPSIEILEALTPSIASDISTSSSDDGPTASELSDAEQASVEKDPPDTCAAENDTKTEEDWRKDVRNKIGPLRRRISVAVEQLRRPLPFFKFSPLAKKHKKEEEKKEEEEEEKTEGSQPDASSDSSETTTSTESLIRDPRLQMVQNFIHDRRFSSPAETFGLNFTQSYRFSYFSLPAHVKKHNEVMSEGAVKLPKIALRPVEKPKPKDVTQMYPSNYSLIDRLVSNSELFK